MINYLLLVLSAVCVGFKNVFAKEGNKYLDEKQNVLTYNFYTFLFAFLLSAIAGHRRIFSISPYTVVVAILYAMFLVLAQMLLVKATEMGGVSVSSLFYSSGFLIPTFASVFLYKETISPLQFIGIIMIIVSFAVTVEKKCETHTKFLLCAVSALFCNGLLGLMQKIFGMSPYSEQFIGFMTIMFLTGTVITFMLMPKKGVPLPSAGFLKTVVFSGIALGLTNNITIYISGILPGVIVFSGVNGGGIIASALIARIIVKEKLSRRKMFGIILGVAAICMVAL